MLAAIQTMFDGMASHNPEMVKSVMTPDARAVGVRGDRVGTPRSRDELAQAIAGGATPILERIWEPKVLVRGRIANVWAEYDFWSNGKFGHCGIDTFLLLKTGEGWKVFSLTYTMETEGCKPSPLGPPK
ncbi:MAG TPA: nuclear transport factor 2 family protein [Candidatus Sulfopaludibacter sp.]|nr:nuclear transport factor 2 family protein [Candidatus Sulfopaludibacter sp.]